MGEIQQMQIEILGCLFSGEKAQSFTLEGLKINFEQVGQAEPLLDEMDRVLAEEEDREGSGPVPLNPSNLASSNTEDRAEHCSKAGKWR